LDLLLFFGERLFGTLGGGFGVRLGIGLGFWLGIGFSLGLSCRFGGRRRVVLRLLGFLWLLISFSVFRSRFWSLCF